MAQFQWEPNVFLHVIDVSLDSIGCLGAVRGADGEWERCTKYMTKGTLKRAKEVLDRISHSDPGCDEDGVDSSNDSGESDDSTHSDRQTMILADLCVCRHHKHQQEEVARMLTERLRPAFKLAASFHDLNHQLTSIRSDLCRKLKIEGGDSPDQRIVEKIHILLNKLSSQGREVKKWKETTANAERMAAKARLESEQEREQVEYVRNRVEELARTLRQAFEPALRHTLEQASAQALRETLEQTLEQAHSRTRDLEERLETSHKNTGLLEGQLAGLRSKVTEKEKSHEDLKLSAITLQVQVEDITKARTALQRQVDSLLQIVTRNSEQSNSILQEQLNSTEQRAADLVQALAALHEENTTAATELVVTKAELQSHQLQLNQATTTIERLELTNVNLQGHVDKEKARKELEASKTWKGRIRNLTKADSETSQRPEEAPLLTNNETTAL